MVDQPQKQSDDTWTYTVVAVMIGFLVILGFVIGSQAIPVLLVVSAIVFGIFTIGKHTGKKCPKCDSKNLNVVKPGFTAKSAQLWTMGLRKAVNLNVCRDCGFSWEDR